MVSIGNPRKLEHGSALGFPTLYLKRMRTMMFNILASGLLMQTTYTGPQHKGAVMIRIRLLGCVEGIVRMVCWSPIP